MFKREIYSTLLTRLQEPRRFLQVLRGPRQVGKTTVARQVMAALSIPAHYASADAPTLRDRTWIEQQWDLGRLEARRSGTAGGALLVLDEIQKVSGWSEIVKHLWDEDTASDTPLKAVLVGSSALRLQSGLSESLAGRFEILPVTHWSFEEMHAAFGWDLEQFVYFGGYPGAATLVDDEGRWSRYITDALIETTVSRDILLMARVDKPALLRRLFRLGCDYSGQVLSYQKMLGQLQDAGNTTTLAHYLDLLVGAGMLTGLPKFSGQAVRQRGSSPKLQVLNTALMTAQSPLSFEDARQDRAFWGRLVESAVGAHLVNTAVGTHVQVFYWRERNKEVDFVLASGDKLAALEVKSGRGRDALPGMNAFSTAFHPHRKLLIGSQGVPLETFLRTPAAVWLEGD